MQSAISIAPVLSPQVKLAPSTGPTAACIRQANPGSSSTDHGALAKRVGHPFRIPPRLQPSGRIAAFWGSCTSTSSAEEYPLPTPCAEPSLRACSHSPDPRSARRHRGAVLPPPAAAGGAPCAGSNGHAARHPVSARGWDEFGCLPVVQQPNYDTASMGAGCALRGPDHDCGTTACAATLGSLASVDVHAMDRFLAALHNAPMARPEPSSAVDRCLCNAAQPCQHSSDSPAGPQARRAQVDVAQAAVNATDTGAEKPGAVAGNAPPSQRSHTDPMREEVGLRERSGELVDDAAVAGRSVWRLSHLAGSLESENAFGVSLSSGRTTKEPSSTGACSARLRGSAIHNHTALAVHAHGPDHSAATSLKLQNSSMGSAGRRWSGDARPDSARLLQGCAAIGADACPTSAASHEIGHLARGASVSQDAFQAALLEQLNSAMQVRSRALLQASSLHVSPSSSHGACACRVAAHCRAHACYFVPPGSPHCSASLHVCGGNIAATCATHAMHDRRHSSRVRKLASANAVRDVVQEKTQLRRERDKLHCDVSHLQEQVAMLEHEREASLPREELSAQHASALCGAGAPAVEPFDSVPQAAGLKGRSCTPR